MYLTIKGYDLKIIQDKLEKVQKNKKSRTFTEKDIVSFIEQVEVITKRLVKEYNSDYIKVSYYNTDFKSAYSYEGTGMNITLTKEGLVNLDTLKIFTTSCSYTRRIEVENISTEITDEDKRKAFKERFNINNHGCINI